MKLIQFRSRKIGLHKQKKQENGEDAIDFTSYVISFFLFALWILVLCVRKRWKQARDDFWAEIFWYLRQIFRSGFYFLQHEQRREEMVSDVHSYMFPDYQIRKQKCEWMRELMNYHETEKYFYCLWQVR